MGFFGNKEVKEKRGLYVPMQVKLPENTVEIGAIMKELTPAGYTEALGKLSAMKDRSDRHVALSLVEGVRDSAGEKDRIDKIERDLVGSNYVSFNEKGERVITIPHGFRLGYDFKQTTDAMLEARTPEEIKADGERQKALLAAALRPQPRIQLRPMSEVVVRDTPTAPAPTPVVA